VETLNTTKNGVFWDVTPCGSCKNRRFRGTYCLHHQGDKNRWTRNVLRLFTANIVPSSHILVTLMLEVLSSSETSALTRAARRNIPEGAILHSHLRENLKSYIKHYIPFFFANSASNSLHEFCMKWKRLQNLGPEETQTDMKLLLCPCYIWRAVCYVCLVFSETTSQHFNL
jgi:hypothetical protein